MDAKSFKKPKHGLGRGLSALISSAPVPVQPMQAFNSAQSPLAEPLASGSKVAISSGQAALDSVSHDGQSDMNSSDTNSTAMSVNALNIESSATQTSSQSKIVTPEATNISERIRYLPLSQVNPNSSQPRRHFDDAEIQELSSSIKELGLLQPVLVRPMPNSSGEAIFEIVAGERRYRAAIQAKLSHLPVIIRNLTDKEGLEIAIVENVQRSNLNPLEEARAYERLAREFHLSQKEIADRVGKDRASIANIMRLINLVPEVQQLLESGKISLGHAKALLTVKEPAAQKNLAKKVVDDGLSVRALEEIVGRVVVLDPSHKKRQLKKTSLANGSAYADGQFPDITDRLRKSLGTKVRVLHHRSGKGKIEIEYFSEAELDRLVDFLTR